MSMYNIKSIIRFWLNVPRNFKQNISYWVKSSSKSAVPEALYIDVTSICNADCIFCVYQYDQRKKEVIKDEIFLKAINEYYEMGGKTVSLTPLLGEVFVDPNIMEKIKYVSEKGFKCIKIYTNATLFHKFGIENILCSGLTCINLSTSPLIEDVYEKMYRIKNYKTVLKNISDLIKTFKELKNKKNSDLKVKEINLEFRADRTLSECQQTDDYNEYIKPHLSEGVTIRGINFFDPCAGNIKQHDLLPGMTLKSPNFLKVLPCVRTSTLQVGTDGKIRACGCRIDTSKEKDDLLVGNLANDSIKNIYNSSKVRNFKKGFYKNKLIESCEKCAWYQI